jgi:hypothetical protein
MKIGVVAPPWLPVPPNKNCEGLMLAFESDFNTARGDYIHILVPREKTVAIGQRVKLYVGDDLEPWAYYGTVVEYAQPCRYGDCDFYNVKIQEPATVTEEDEMVS